LFAGCATIQRVPIRLILLLGANSSERVIVGLPAAFGGAKPV
jgi:hypothetical protein